MTINEQVEVRRGDNQGPEQFLWRGRLWLVREVLGRPVGTEEVWRVRAAAGRAAVEAGLQVRPLPVPEVFDLSFDWVSGDWRLAGVGR